MQSTTAISVPDLAAAASDATQRARLSRNDVSRGIARRQQVRVAQARWSAQRSTQRWTSRRGLSLWLTVAAMTVLCGFMSFAVDLGRVQLAKAELHRAADAAARAAASDLGQGIGRIRKVAREYAAYNKVDGQPLQLENSDIEVGYWDGDGRTFTPTGNDTRANAVRITARRSQQRGNGIPLLFARVLGPRYCDVHASSVAMLIPGADVDRKVNATANPFLAGMPKGTLASPNNPHNSPDFAGVENHPDPAVARQSPPRMTGLTIREGATLTFDSIDGVARHDPDLPFFDPDGQLTDIGRNTAGAEHGKSDLKAPINALVGVFLTDENPAYTPAPKMLDFSTRQSREFTTLAPELKQLFWIGDGKTGDGVTQQFVVPPGATRLYLATWDFFEWNNNYGWRTIKITRPAQVVTVQ